MTILKNQRKKYIGKKSLKKRKSLNTPNAVVELRKNLILIIVLGCIGNIIVDIGSKI